MNDLKNTTDLKQNNRNRIYNYIYHSTNPVTKQDIVQELSLSLPTVTVNLAQLMEEKLIATDGKASSTGGRKAKMIRVLPTARFAVGIAITDQSILFTAIGLKVETLATQKITLPFEDKDSYYKLIVSYLVAFLGEIPLGTENLLGVGIALPGIIREDTHMIEFIPTLSLRQKKLDDIKKYFQYPVYVQNDANASGYAEWFYREDEVNIAYLSMDRGVGGAVLLGGKSYLGDNSRSAEFGHICIVPDGKKCSCGKCGCFEAYCSTTVLSDDIGMSIESFFEKIKDGDRKYQKIWKEYLSHLVQGITTIQMILDCNVVIGGSLSNFIENDMIAIHQQMQSSSPFGNQNLKITSSRYQSLSASIGSALYYVQKFIGEI